MDSLTLFYSHTMRNMYREVEDATSTPTTPYATPSSVPSPSPPVPTPISRNSRTLIEVLPAILPIAFVIVTVACIYFWRRQEKRHHEAARAHEMAQMDDDFFPTPISPFIPLYPYTLRSGDYGRTSGEDSITSMGSGKGTRRSDTPPLYSSLRFASDDEGQASSLLLETNHVSSTSVVAEAASGICRVSSPPAYMISDEEFKNPRIL